MTGIAIKAEEITASYGAPGSDGVAVLDRLSISAGAGEIVTIVGPSGCGKTTLLKLVAGLLENCANDFFFTGKIRLMGHVDSKAPAVYLSQRPCLLPWRSVAENICLPLELSGNPIDRSRAEQLASVVGVSDFMDSLPHQLSGGMLQRVAIARSLVLSPAILLLDEPFAHLDEATRNQLHRDVRAIVTSRGITAIIVSHSVSEAVLLATSKVVVMSARPASVVATIEVPSQQDAHARDISSPEYVSAVKRARDALGVDTVREASAAGSVTGEGK